MPDDENITVQVRDAAGMSQMPQPLKDCVWLAVIGRKKIVWLAVSEKGLQNSRKAGVPNLSFQACLINSLAERYFEAEND